MIRIGLVGEDPNDTSSIKNLLCKRYNQIHFKPIAKGIRGYELNNPKLARVLVQEMMTAEYHFIVFIRDLDGLETHVHRVKERNTWFDKLNIVSNDKGIFLLNIYELEALILADIANFNQVFGTKLKFNGNPMKVSDPKGYLKKITNKHRRKYSESDCPEIFKHLDIDTIAKNCRYFKEFLSNFDKKINKAA